MRTRFLLNRRSAAWVALLSIIACALSLGTRAQENGPPATIGLVKGLSVTQDIEGTFAEGSLFPVATYITPVTRREPRWGWKSTVALDTWGQGMVEDVYAYLTAAEQMGRLRIPDAFPQGYRCTIDFTDARDLVAGDSAGVAIAVALYSALTDTPVLDEVAITGALSRDGSIRSVGDLAMKIDGVIGSHTGTMILPAENFITTPDEMEEVTRRAFPDIRIVAAANMEQALFHACGPYGPRGDEYREYSSRYEAAVRATEERRFDEALETFRELGRLHPEDNTAPIWYAHVRDAYIADLLQKAKREMHFDDTDRAREFVLKAAQIAPEDPTVEAFLSALIEGGPVPEILPVPSVVAASDEVVLGEPLEDDGPVVARFVEAAPLKPTSRYWATVRPRNVRLRSVRGRAVGSEARVAAAYTQSALCLLVAVKDAGGTADRIPPQWVLQPGGFSQVGQDDWFFLVWDRDLRTGRQAIPADHPPNESIQSALGDYVVDAWHWFAGSTGLVGAADDIHITAELQLPDEGRGPSQANLNAETLMPEFAFNGKPGLYGPTALSLGSMALLEGDPVAGLEAFEAQCSRCHFPEATPAQGGPIDGISLRPGGSVEALRAKLAEPIHAEHAKGASTDDLIAYMRASQPIPLAICSRPSGSRGNVRAASVFAGGWWYVIFHRRLTTGAPDDMPMVVGGDYGLFVIATDGATGRQVVSERITLDLAPQG